MPLRLYVLSADDPDDRALVSAIARVHLAAWLTNAIYRAIYYGPPASHAGIIEANQRRHEDSLTTNPSAQFAVVLDDAVAGVRADQVIAWVKYDVFESARAEEERQDTGKRAWPPYTNQVLVDHFWGLITASRKRQGGSIGPHVSVDLLATSPEHHRRGVGRMLMDHVAREADRLRLPATLEGSPEGVPLYSAVGFAAVDEF
jgi:GNAT superfamily N-acetyltransferase